MMTPIISSSAHARPPAAYADDADASLKNPALSGAHVEELLIRGPLEAMLRRPDGTMRTEDEVKAKAREICELLIHLHDEKANLSPADEAFADRVALDVFKDVHLTPAAPAAKPEPKATVIQDKLRAEVLKVLEGVDKVARNTKINNDDKDLTVAQRQTLLEQAVINPIVANNPMLAAVRKALNQQEYTFSKFDRDELSRMIREVVGLPVPPVIPSPGTPNLPDTGAPSAIQGAIKADVKKILQTTDRLARTTNVNNNGKDFTPEDRKTLLLRAVDNPIEATNAVLRTVRSRLNDPNYVLTKADHAVLATMISEQVADTSGGGKPPAPNQPEKNPPGTQVIEEIEEVVEDAPETTSVIETLDYDRAILAPDAGVFHHFGRRRNRYIVPSSRSTSTIAVPRDRRARYYIVEP
jgi:hypothetical protein